MAARQRPAFARHNAIGDFMHYKGKKKGLIILVEFANKEFLPENDSLRYTRICNEEGYNEGKFRGSVSDYFKDQSYGEFELTFDVTGPVQMDSTYQYYGRDLPGADAGNDAHPGEMTAKACMAVDDQVDFTDYDWDGDGYVDQVMIIYAGAGQASGGASDTIWPHEWDLADSDYGQELELDGVKINTYACANEREGNSVGGIGTICHEFSHCLGLPDMYDINYGGNFGMGDWSPMDNGSYNGNGFCPAGYTSFERYTCGWANPVELLRNEQIDNMQSLAKKPEVYMIRNDAYNDEYYLIENRQRVGWDAELPGSGMLIIHVDYDRKIWENNLVNTNYHGGGGYPANDHQRCTIFHASNKSSGYWHDSSADPYPYQKNDSLTNTSEPAARLYHENLEGHMLMDKGIMEITRNDDGTMSFRFRNSAEEIYLPAGTIFYESFNQCLGIGGNDGTWNAMIASSNFVPDNEGWTVQKPYGGFHCARFGNGSTEGMAMTPPIKMETNRAELTFRAAGWNKDGTTLTLSVEGEGEVEPATVTMENFAWNDYKVTLKGSGELRVAFAPEKRFLLDDVLVVALATDTITIVPDTTVVNPDTTTTDPDTIVSTSITTHHSRLTSRKIGYYTLDGRYAGASLEALPYGMYILYSTEDRKGRKIVK